MPDHTDTLIDLALAEDIGSGDVTSTYFIPKDRKARAFMAVRHRGVVSGIELAARVFEKVDPILDVEILINDGSQVSEGALVMRIEGSARSILTAERTALNFAQRLSGVASLTATYVNAIKDTQTQILDTRKTTPGYRALEKQAVIHGGGANHRMGLYDRAMIKDNHLVADGNLSALQAAIQTLKSNQPEVEVELEADNIEQVEAFLKMDQVDYILLDNMSLEDLATAVEMRGDNTSPRLEASGGVTLDTVHSIALTGVDYISVGALTHSAPALDIGLDFNPL